jgi:hypothetical protein
MIRGRIRRKRVCAMPAALAATKCPAFGRAYHQN